jgi:hypothetical protein
VQHDVLPSLLLPGHKVGALSESQQQVKPAIAGFFVVWCDVNIFGASAFQQLPGTYGTLALVKYVRIRDSLCRYDIGKHLCSCTPFKFKFHVYQGGEQWDSPDNLKVGFKDM